MNSILKKESIKQEVIANINNNEPLDCCNIARLSGIIHTSGIISFSDIITIIVHCEYIYIVEFVVKSLRNWNVLTEIEQHREEFNLRIYGVGIKDLLMDVGIILHNNIKNEYQLNKGIDEFLVIDKCCKQAYLQGVFLACGSINIGSNKNVVLKVDSMILASEIQLLLEQFDIIFKRKTDEKISKNSTFLYMYNGEKIADFLALIGASKSVLLLHNAIIKNERIRDANRGINCIISNLDKSVEFCLDTVNICELIKSSEKFEKLDRKLQQTITGRLLKRDLSLAQLAVYLRVSKSCVKHRLNKLKDIAQNINNL